VFEILTRYGQGSARDWAAKGTALLGVKFLLAKSYERIHRSNLVGMGVVPLQFYEGEDAGRLGLDGTEHFDVTIPEDAYPGMDGIVVKVDKRDGSSTPWQFEVKLRLDTLVEVDFYKHGGVMPYVMRQLAAGGD
jgi:aconitate hydratase